MTLLGGIAIGGTNSILTLANSDPTPAIIFRETIPTEGAASVLLPTLAARLRTVSSEIGSRLTSVGVTCGGPLDEVAGLVLSPPNLPGWDCVPLVSLVSNEVGVPTRLMNDANAGALAEWVWGAGRGASTLVFLTMGTGIGAGLILSGRLHRGASGMAGELGHWRLRDHGPVGYAKAGSVEGFCSGGGIAQWAHLRRVELLGDSHSPSSGTLRYSALDLAVMADKGDPFATQLWSDVGDALGATLALVIDFLNPDAIVIGGIFPRQEFRLRPSMERSLHREALPENLECCTIRGSELGERISDYSALAVAMVGQQLHDVAAQLTNAVEGQ